MLDVTDADTIATAAATVPELDLLVNNAGISLDTGAPVTETDVEVPPDINQVDGSDASVDL